MNREMRRRRRDMARRRTEMPYMDMRGSDGRNPYGSKGGYVVSSRRQRNSMDYANEDMARREGMRRDYLKEYDPNNFEVYSWDSVDEARREDYARRNDYPRRNDYEGYDRHYMPYEIYGTVSPSQDYAPRRMSNGRYRDYAYQDYGEEAETLDEKELMQWSKKLLKEVDPSYKEFFTVENIEKRAKDLGIDFKEFTFEEFYTTTLMMFTDYFKTIGAGNMDTYLRLAKDWLCDEDVSVQYGEKLAKYHDEIVSAE